MGPAPRISVVVRSYNRLGVLAELLEILLAQDHDSFEIVVQGRQAHGSKPWAGIDPIVVAFVMLPVFYALGAVVYQVYYQSFEKRGQESLRGLAFFFGLLFVTEVSLILVFGVDYRYVEAVSHCRQLLADIDSRNPLVPQVLQLLGRANQQLGLYAESERYYKRAIVFSGPALFPTLGRMPVAISLVIVLAVAILSALYPALLAMRVSPVEAMSSED